MVKPILKHNFLYRTLIMMALAVGMVSFAPSFDDDGPFSATETRVNVTRYYPNPATTIINFEFGKNINKNYTLQIYSFTGRKMYEKAVNAERVTVKLDDFYRGVYFFHLRDRSGKVIETGKFQVVK